MGSIGQTSTFSEHGHVAYHFKSDNELQQRGSEYFARRPLRTLHLRPRGWGQLVKIQLFSEHGHLTYQIKENHEYSNMVVNILPSDLYASRLWGWDQ